MIVYEGWVWSIAALISLYTVFLEKWLFWNGHVGLKIIFDGYNLHYYEGYESPFL